MLSTDKICNYMQSAAYPQVQKILATLENRYPRHPLGLSQKIRLNFQKIFKKNPKGILYLKIIKEDRA